MADSDRPSAPPASARTVTRYVIDALYDKREEYSGHTLTKATPEDENRTQVVLYAEVASLLTAVAEAEQTIASLTDAAAISSSATPR